MLLKITAQPQAEPSGGDSISYTGLSANKTNQTFIGCKLGDVNWDWNPATAKPVNNNNNAIELSYSPVKVVNSDLINIPVKVKNFKDLQGMQFTVHFNAEVMKWKGIENNLLNFETGTNHAEEGNISFLWVDPSNTIKTLEDGSVMMNLVFERTGKCINEQLELNDDVTSIAVYDKDYQLHGLVLKPAMINSDILSETWTVSPNPTTNGVIHVQMNLKDNKSLVFRLIDNTGRLIMTKQVEGSKGNNNINLKDGNIPSGTYFLQALGIEGVKQLRINN